MVYYEYVSGVKNRGEALGDHRDRPGERHWRTGCPAPTPLSDHLHRLLICNRRFSGRQPLPARWGRTGKGGFL